jgi:hypothetical protein
MMGDPRRWPVFFLGLVAILAWLPLGGIAAQEGGGADEELYEVMWASYAEALEKALEKKVGFLIYFPPEGQGMDHEIFRLKPMLLLSRDHPCVRIHYSPDQPLREAFRITKAATILLADWHGNEVQRFALEKPTQKFAMRPIEETMKKMPEIVKGIEKKLEKQCTKAEKDLKRKKYASAVETLRKVTEYRGYDAATRAEEALEKAYDAGEKEVEKALQLAEKSRKKAVAALKKLIEEFQDSRVEDAAWEALEKINEQKKE